LGLLENENKTIPKKQVELQAIWLH